MNERNFKYEFKFWKYAFKSIGKGITINENSGCFFSSSRSFNTKSIKKLVFGYSRTAKMDRVYIRMPNYW